MESKLENSRRELLDLSARNRLINTRRAQKRSTRLDVVDELTEEIFRILVRDKKKMSFLPGQSDDLEEGETSQVDFFGTSFELDNEPAAHHVDAKLQTKLEMEPLQKKLLKLFYDARTSEEEQGVNTLYLACGFLKWYESENSDRERQAPLILIPVKLDRKSATAKFHLSWDENELATNLSIKEKLYAEFGLQLPEIGDIEEFSPNDYLREVSDVIRDKDRWEVMPNGMVLWLFSFAKFLMYKDLDPEAWPGETSITNNENISSMMGGGFRSEPSICGEQENIDKYLSPATSIHVMDADSSQALAIEEVKQGRNLVIQGPPGTGKSQTISNLIASAVSEGKRVLFVSEKMAALQVVKRRMDTVGLGAACLELHSNKANKKAVLDDLDRTLKLGAPVTEGVAENSENLQIARDKLNRYCEQLHSKLEPSQFSTFQVIGELVKLQRMGVHPQVDTLEDSIHWTRQQFEKNQALIQDLAEHGERVGNPKVNVWRGAAVNSILPSDKTRIVELLNAVKPLAESLVAACKLVNESLGVNCTSLRDIVEVASMIRTVSTIPSETDFAALETPVWSSMADKISKLIENGQRFAELSEHLESVITDQSIDDDWESIYSELYHRAKSPFRFFHLYYLVAWWKMQRALVKKGIAPEEQVKIAGWVAESKRCRKQIQKLSSIGHEAFGKNWFGEESNWKLLNDLNEWVSKAREDKIPGTVLSILDKISGCEKVSTAMELISKCTRPFSRELKSLTDLIKLNSMHAFGCSSINDVPVTMLQVRIDRWDSELDGLRNWIQFNNRVVGLRSGGLNWLADNLFEGRLTHESLVGSFDFRFYENLLRHVFASSEDLRDFSGVSHNELIAEFRRLDEARLRFARQEVAASHYKQIPRYENSAGELNVIKKEVNKKRKHLPVRKLISKAGRAIQTIKPVFMMSPISVAQFLEPGGLGFDLLLIDEASQVKPVDAFGAVARCKQIVVVGDSKQLPPTSFFEKAVDAESEDDDDSSPGDVESILGLCVAEGMNQRMLKWHYRSRHQSLIAVSNHEFYGNELFVVPSPFESSKEIGLSFNYVKDGVFDRGKSRINRNEASCVADAVIEHARHHPDKSLGIGVFSVAQRDAILDELELRRRQNEDVEEFFLRGGSEPFFVKNLENIQGDERDVIFISVGYGKDDAGYFSMNFGPINNEGGERRLNVLISRAKERCVVFSSIVADDIDLNRSKARGVKALKTFLSYAKTGILDIATESGEGYDSEFERQVGNALKDLGYQIRTQVGVAGFKIDLAIVDEEKPGRYRLGIECDGAQYHSSRSARDRDRLRQVVLEDRGWNIHRVWSTDWFHDPENELRKIASALNDPSPGVKDEVLVEPECPEILEDVEQPRILRIDKVESVSKRPAFVEPYRLADFDVNNLGELHEVGSVVLSQVVYRTVELEEPIHKDELARRISGFFGLSRLGKRAATAIEEALDYGIHNLGLQKHGDFIYFSGEQKLEVRDRSELDIARLRKVESIAPSEFRRAVKGAIETHIGIEPSELTKEVASYFGFQSISKKLREKVESELEGLIGDDEIEVRQQRLYALEKPRSASQNELA